MEDVSFTNDEAVEGKRSAVFRGYYRDEYISYFVKNPDRKAPEINRGYYARVKGVEMCIERFLKKAGDKCQIVNLGCGFDTLFFRLRDAGHAIQNFVEIDLPSVTSQKCYLIKRNKSLLEKIHSEDGEVRLSSTDLHSGNYHIVGVDLRNIDECANKLQQSEVDFNVPTIFLAECVLVYVEPQNSSNLLSWISSNFKSAVFINYEQVNMNDRFGEVMLQNLRGRGCSLAGVEACLTLDTQVARFLNSNWTGARAWDMVKVYNSIPAAERQRIEKLEMLDEGELLVQLFQHYCISIAWLGDLFQDVDECFKTVERRLSSIKINAPN